MNATDPDGTIHSYQWNFDDGTFSALRNVSHTFYSGKYEMVTTVTDNEGSATSKKVTINVYNQLPAISLSALPTMGFAPLEVYFNGTGHDIDGTISYYHWDFKDNHTSDMANPFHIFHTPGEYNVSFTIIDNDGAIVSDQVSIVVKEPSILRMKECIEDYVENIDNATKVIYKGYKSFDDGDTIIIRDILNKSTYDEVVDISYVEFGSYLGYPLAFQGDISSKFQPGGSVDLTVHIIQVTFHKVMENKTWTVILETFKEGWNTTDNSIDPIPQQYLTKTKE